MAQGRGTEAGIIDGTPARTPDTTGRRTARTPPRGVVSCPAAPGAPFFADMRPPRVSALSETSCYIGLDKNGVRPRCPHCPPPGARRAIFVKFARTPVRPNCPPICPVLRYNFTTRLIN